MALPSFGVMTNRARIEVSRPDPGCDRVCLPPCGPRASRIGAASEDFMNTTVELPHVTIATHDFNRLMSVATMDQNRRKPHRHFLISELRRASLCHPEALPEDVVSTNAKVTYRIDGSGRSLAHVLVYPE